MFSEQPNKTISRKFQCHDCGHVWYVLDLPPCTFCPICGKGGEITAEDKVKAIYPDARLEWGQNGVWSRCRVVLATSSHNGKWVLSEWSPSVETRNRQERIVWDEAAKLIGGVQP